MRGQGFRIRQGHAQRYLADSHEPESKLLKGGYIEGYAGEYYLSPHYPRKKKGSLSHEYKESHTPESIKDP